MNEIEFWQVLLNKMVVEGFLTIDEGSLVLKQLEMEVET